MGKTIKTWLDGKTREKYNSDPSVVCLSHGAIFISMTIIFKCLPIKAKWHVEHPWVMRRKCLEHLCHITKMATTLIWWKPFKTVFLLANKKSQWAWFWNVEIKLWAYHCSFKWWPLIGLLSISRRKCVSILQHRDTLKTCHTRWYCH